MSTDITSGVALPEFKGADTEAWDETRIISVSDSVDKIALEIGSDGYVDVVQVVEEKLGITDLSVMTPTPNPIDFVHRQRPKPRPKQSRQQAEDPDKYLMMAKALVVQNYNEHRDPRRSPVLTMDLVFITQFSKAAQNWKALVGSTVVRGLIWEVTFNGSRDEDGQLLNEAYIDIFKKINHIKIPLGE
jgi:hypothetical protein